MVRLPKREASWRAASSAAACLAGAFASELPRGLRRSACAPQCGGLSKHGLTDKKVQFLCWLHHHMWRGCFKDNKDISVLLDLSFY
ncbi:hypothetical protein PR003_g6227 [Phytophthora rubi]|uniref:Uncharacterized protein n=1 Tax=Phytophthora rubi TaxID=129364 RepID=A0A6A4FQ87_9STRA|nr:hypothetical protein PR002_g4125 [Phytophthora rubi]KAE9043090.1 hypothetical protein PR001_g5929 [Phytophthora rubi]KAE9348769.1 hypothetical protein PR003_g6227 [Phytophthora rubi]